MATTPQSQSGYWAFASWGLAFVFPFLIFDASINSRILHTFTVAILCLISLIANLVSRNNKTQNVLWWSNIGFAKILFFWQLLLLLAFQFASRISEAKLFEITAAIESNVPILSRYAIYLRLQGAPIDVTLKVQLAIAITLLAAIWFAVRYLVYLRSIEPSLRIDAYNRFGGPFVSLVLLMFGLAIAYYFLDVTNELGEAPKFGIRSRCNFRLACFSKNEIALLSASATKLAALLMAGSLVAGGIDNITLLFRKKSFH
jgi:hypothetical protein